MRTCELRIRKSSAWTASCTRHGTAAALHSARTALRVPPESQEANALPSTVSKAANELNATGLLAYVPVSQLPKQRVESLSSSAHSSKRRSISVYSSL